MTARQNQKRGLTADTLQAVPMFEFVGPECETEENAGNFGLQIWFRRVTKRIVQKDGLTGLVNVSLDDIVLVFVQ